MPTKTDGAALRAAIQHKSISATVLTVVTAAAGLAVSLGAISAGQQGAVDGATVAATALAGVVAGIVHTGKISPSALTTSIAALVAQVGTLAVSFGVGTQTTGTVAGIVMAVVLAGVQIAHALISRQVA